LVSLFQATTALTAQTIVTAAMIAIKNLVFRFLRQVFIKICTSRLICLIAIIPNLPFGLKNGKIKKIKIDVASAGIVLNSVKI
jgi:hypothetical protein